MKPLVLLLLLPLMTHAQPANETSVRTALFRYKDSPVTVKEVSSEQRGDVTGARHKMEANEIARDREEWLVKELKLGNAN